MKKAFFLFLFFLLFIGITDVEAKSVKKTCKYSYVHDLRKSGSTEVIPANDGGTITLYIYDDGSQDGKGKSNGKFLSENFGGEEELLNWGSTTNDAPNIKGNDCPTYIGVIVEGLGDRKWYGFSTDTLNSHGKKVADHDNSDSMALLKWDDYTEKVPTYKCEYTSTAGGTSVSYVITVDTGTKSLSISSKYATTGIFYWETDELKNTWFSEDRGTDECLPTVACGGKTNLAGQINYYVFNDSMEAKAAGYDGCTVRECTGDDCNSNAYSCTTYNTYIKKIKEVYGKIQNNPDNAGSYYSEANSLEVQLASLCKGVMESYTFKEQCVKACVGFEAEMAKLKVAYGIGTAGDGGTGSCSLSQRLTNWIFKIVKWVRYLVPILLILLSVMDFMKAIASDSEDEMRKVGTKFVKRLIVAAIIFILPLILEFLLGIFGIATNDYCI